MNNTLIKTDAGDEMIQIDDAGSGSLVGGTCIGVLRPESGEFYYEIIPVRLYNEENFKKKEYIYYTTNVIKNAFNHMGVSRSEEIAICQGYMFEDARVYLKENGFNVESGKIGDPLQPLIEKTFEDYTISLGLPRDFIAYTKYPFHFHRLLKWVYADYENRTALCKTGWKSWGKCSGMARNVYYDKLLRSNYVCLKCGNRIPDNSRVKVIKFFTDKVNYVYIHKNC